jgi:hypothetical protein
METWDEVQLRGLQATYINWDIWTVPIYMPRGTHWCARPKGAPVATVNEDSPENLIKAIAEQESQDLQVWYGVTVHLTCCFALLPSRRARP